MEETPKKDYTEWSVRPDGRKFRPFLRIYEVWELMDMRFGISYVHFYNLYRRYFPMEYYGISRRTGSPSDKRISFIQANEIIDKIISGELIPEAPEPKKQMPSLFD